MATESVPPAPHLALVIDAAKKFEKLKDAKFEGALYLAAADEVIEDTIYVLSLLEAYAFIDNERHSIDPHAISRAASMLVEKLRKAQRYMRGKS